MIEAAAASIPLGRMGEPEDDSSFVSGSELFVDGGSARV
jgi:hypothetical protein